MAWLLVAPCWRDLRLLRLEVDLHGYRVETAAGVMAQKAREAWANGFGEAVFRHGASTARFGAGTIREALRDALGAGEFDAYLRFRGRERLWTAYDTYAVLELADNPRPRHPRSFTPLPRPEYPSGQGRSQPPAEATPPGRSWSG
ncbi:MAG: hypothetical protein NTZ05_10730 [Chloroflexi bacterium]|nr:hypothetical protein [Chloroflexota bacterium]